MRTLFFSLLSVAVFVALCAWFSGSSQYNLFHFPLDDAWIHAVYARSLLLGQGFAYNPPVQEAGATSPLWAIVSAPAQVFAPLGVPSMVVALKVLGVLLTGGFLLSLPRLARALGCAPSSAALAGLLLLAGDSRLVFNALSGMENSLLLFLWIRWLIASVERRALCAILWASFLPLARPEALLLTLATPLILWRWSGFLLFPIALLPSALWVWFCRSVNGGYVPNTFYLKAESGFPVFQANILQLGELLFAYGNLGCALSLLGLASFLWKFRAQRRELFSLLILPLVYVLMVLASRSMLSDGFYWSRWLDPALAMLSVCAVLGLAPVVWSGGALRILTLCALVLSLPHQFFSLVERNSRLSSDSRAIAQINEAAGNWLRSNTPTSSIVAAQDAGAIRYLSGRTVLDVVGLNCADVVKKTLSFPQIVERSDYLVLAPQVFRGIETDPRFREAARFSVPVAEYTVCACPAQSEVGVFAKTAPK